MLAVYVPPVRRYVRVREHVLRRYAVLATKPGQQHAYYVYLFRVKLVPVKELTVSLVDDGDADRQRVEVPVIVPCRLSGVIGDLVFGHHLRARNTTVNNDVIRRNQ